MPLVCSCLGRFIDGCSKTQEVEIGLFERIDNTDFNLSSIDFEVSNDLLQFKNAYLLVTVQLYDLRYLLQTWFFTSAAIILLSVSSFLTLIVGGICY
jgi:hypothetical protein